MIPLMSKKMKRKICILIVGILSTLQIVAQDDSIIVTLSQSIDAALRYNPSIKESTNDANISELAVKKSRSGLYPVLSTEISGGFSREYRFKNDYKTVNSTIAAEQVLWQNGKVNAGIDQARYSKQAADFSLEGQKQEVILAVKTAYFNCLMQNQLYEIAVDNVSKANLFLEYARERYKVGAARKYDVLKAESDLSEAEFERDTFLNSLAEAQNELSMLTSLPPTWFSKLENTWRSDQLDASDEHIDTIRSKTFRNYPELQVVNNLQLSQQARITQTNAELYPRLGLNAGYNWNYNPTYQEIKGWYTALTLRWVLFNGNQQRNQVKEEKIRKTIYENQAEEVRNFLLKEISNRLINIKEAESQIRQTDHLMKTTLENLEIAKGQYKAGTGSLLELTDARISDLLAKQKNIQAITAYQIALANLERLTGDSNEIKK